MDAPKEEKREERKERKEEKREKRRRRREKQTHHTSREERSTQRITTMTRSELNRKLPVVFLIPFFGTCLKYGQSS